MAVDGFDSTAVLFAWKNGTAVLLLMGRWQSLRAIALRQLDTTIVLNPSVAFAALKM